MIFELETLGLILPLCHHNQVTARQIHVLLKTHLKSEFEVF